MGDDRATATGTTVAACTVITREQVPAARLLAATYREHHPTHEFVVLVVTGSEAEFAGPAWLGLDPDEFLRMATCHTGEDLVDAVRPLLLRKLLEHHDVAVLLSPDTRVYAPFAEVSALAAEHGLVVTPSVLAPLPGDGCEPFDAPGLFNGFLAAGRAAVPFLGHWAEKALLREPRDSGTWAWTDLIAGVFPHEIVRDPGLAVGYWNLHERPLTDGPHGPVVDGAPLRFLCFRAYDPELPWLLSTNAMTRPRVTLSGAPVLAALCDDYGRKLLGRGGETFDELPDGTPLTREMRQLYHDAWIRTERPLRSPDPFGQLVQKVPPHPFGDDDGLAFRQWLTEPATPAEAASGMNRLATRVWANRIDLQVAFPQPTGRDTESFRHWCATHGVAEKKLPEWALPHEPPPLSEPVAEFGVNVAGYLTAELGLGEMARVAQRAIAASGIPMASVVEEYSLSGSVRTALDAPDSVGAPRYGVSLLTVNSDFTGPLLESHPDVGHHRYRIGLWAWELEEFPESMHDGFALVDEVWTPSDFARKTIAAHSPVPVKTIPVPVLDPGPVTRPSRAPGDVIQFLFIFDFNSTGGRKNPWGVVTAFQQAFPSREDVRLVIKATNGHRKTSARERLRRMIGDDPRIELREHYLSVAELDALYAETDAYVSLHRSEGFGLTVAEAMVRGVPVIATDYSGTSEFFGEGLGWPIPYTMTEVGEGWAPYQPDGHWADPDLDAAASAMRAVADDPAEARRRGEAAREHVLRTRSMDTAAAWMREQLQAAHKRWQSREAKPPESTPQRHPFLTRARRTLRPLRVLARRIRAVG